MDGHLRKTYRSVEQKLRELADRPLEALIGLCAESAAISPEESHAEGAETAEGAEKSTDDIMLKPEIRNPKSEIEESHAEEAERAEGAEKRGDGVWPKSKIRNPKSEIEESHAEEAKSAEGAEKSTDNIVPKSAIEESHAETAEEAERAERSQDRAGSKSEIGNRKSGIQEAAQFGDDPPLRRLLSRLGLIPRSRSTANLYEMVRRIAAATGERTSVVRRVLQLYCSPAEGIRAVVCGDEPSCQDCPLVADCRHYQRTPSIKELPSDQRPRERLIAAGERTLSDAELLAIILRSGTEEHTAIGLAQNLLGRFGNFRALAGKSVAELSTVKGVGPAKAAQVKAALEIGRRLAQQAATTEPRAAITDSQRVYDLCWPRLRDQKKETFLVLLLDAKNRVTREVEVSVGSLTASLVHPREVFHEAVRDSAAAVVCVHNHPSGDPTPSVHDIEITRKLAESSKVLGISLLDHVILGEGAYYSFADEGRLPEQKRHDG